MNARAHASPKPGQAPHLLSVYDGAVHIGDLKDCGKHGIVAYTIGKRGRIKVGTFETRADAMRALNDKATGRA